jgi:hypothetical protein
VGRSRRERAKGTPCLPKRTARFDVFGAKTGLLVQAVSVMLSQMGAERRPAGFVSPEQSQHDFTAQMISKKRFRHKFSVLR